MGDIDLNNILSTSKRRKKKSTAYDEDSSVERNVVRDIVKDMEENSLQNVVKDLPAYNSNVVIDRLVNYTNNDSANNSDGATASMNVNEAPEMNDYSTPLPPKLKDVLKEKAIFENFIKQEENKG